MDIWLMSNFVEAEQLNQIAMTAEESGFTGLTLSDHIVFPQNLSSKYPYSKDKDPTWSPTIPWPDCWVSIAAMASVTTKLKFTTTVYIAPLRDPFNLAKFTSTASIFSQGRMACGFGAGWMEEEFTLVEQQFARRGARFDEMIEIMRRLWSGEMVDFHGEFYDFDPVQMSQPAYGGDIPIWVGGLKGAALARAARNNGWIGAYESIEETKEQMDQINAHREAMGNTDKPFEFMTCIPYYPTDEILKGLEDIGMNSVAVGLSNLTKTRDLEGRLESIRKAGKDFSL